MPTRFVVIVHPGSLCGSYHTSPGFDQYCLDELLAEISDEREKGAIVGVIEGELDDELPRYPRILSTVACPDYSTYSDITGLSLKRAARRVEANLHLHRAESILVTGAWGDGCAEAVAIELAALLPVEVDVALSSWAPAFCDETSHGFFVDSKHAGDRRFFVMQRHGDHREPEPVAGPFTRVSADEAKARIERALVHRMPAKRPPLRPQL